MQLNPPPRRPSRHERAHSRRDFFKMVMGRTLAGASILEIAQHQAAWAQALAPNADPTRFEIRKAKDGIFQAFAKPDALLNSNAVIFVNSKEVIVVDSHSRPSSSASLVAQIKKEITDKPIKYLIDSHFHWDHANGNATYDKLGAKIIANRTTQRLMEETSASRVKGTLDANGHVARGMASVPAMIEATKEQIAGGKGNADALKLRLQQMEAYTEEMKSFSPTLPNVLFDKSYLLKDKDFDLHIVFNGRAHTAGDTQVYCPAKGAIATGDVAAAFLGDGFPRDWPRTLDNIMKLKFDTILPGHGPIQTDHKQMIGMRDYMAELTPRIIEGKHSGKSITDLQKTITVASLKAPLAPNMAQAALDQHILHMYDRVDLK